jgi:hypothetical protein
LGRNLSYEWGEVQTFELAGAGEGKMELTRAQLVLILEGIDLSSVRQRKRYNPKR